MCHVYHPGLNVSTSTGRNAALDEITKYMATDVGLCTSFSEAKNVWKLFATGSRMSLDVVSQYLDDALHAIDGLSGNPGDGGLKVALESEKTRLRKYNDTATLRQSNAPDDLKQLMVLASNQIIEEADRFATNETFTDAASELATTYRGETGLLRELAGRYAQLGIHGHVTVLNADLESEIMPGVWGCRQLEKEQEAVSKALESLDSEVTSLTDESLQNPELATFAETYRRQRALLGLVGRLRQDQRKILEAEEVALNRDQSQSTSGSDQMDSESEYAPSR